MTEHTTAADANAGELSGVGRTAGAAHGVSRRGVLQSRKVRHWISVCSLALSDVTAFALAEIFFRLGRNVPKIVLYRHMLPSSGAVDMFYLLAAAFIVARYIFGDYSRRQLFWDGAKASTVALMITSIPSFLALAFTTANFSTAAVTESWAFVVVAVPALRQITRSILSGLSLWQLPTALVGNGPAALEAFDAFRRSLALGFDVQFLVAWGNSSDTTEDIAGVTRINLSDPANIVRRLSSAGCLEAVLAIEGQPDAMTDNIIQQFMAADIGVAIIPPLRRVPLLGLTTNYFFGRDLLLLQVRNNMDRLPGRIFKRLTDIVGSIALLIGFLPVYIIVAILVKLDDDGPVFFRQERIGRNGEPFNCIKFRTMTLDAEDQLNHWLKENSCLYEEYRASNFKLRNDPRTTRVGRILRRTSLDELPQLINVLMGEMSLVGPRPLVAREVREYGTAIKLYERIRPGMTGLWQISGRSLTSFADRISLDEWYIKNWSFWYDVVILLQTVWVLIGQDGAY